MRLPVPALRPLLRSTTFAGAALVAAVALACGGGGDEPEPVTAEQATAIVSDGLLTAEDLPNASWETEETDLLAAGDSEGESDIPLEDPDDLFDNTPSCQAVAEALGVLDEEDGPPSLADVERSFTVGGTGDSLVLRNVVSNVFVPDPEVGVAEPFEQLRGVFNADSMRPCFEDAFRASFEEGEGVILSSIDVYEPDRVVTDGVGIAVDLQAIAMFVPLDLHLQMHFWPEGPAAGTLMLLEMNSELVQRNAGSIVDNASTRLAAAVEANTD